VAKRTLQISEFYGGLNNASNADNLQEKECASAIGCSFSSIGTISQEGNGDTIKHNDTELDGFNGLESVNLPKQGGLKYIVSDWKWNLVQLKTSGAHGLAVGNIVGDRANFLGSTANVGEVQSVPDSTTVILYNYRVADTSWAIAANIELHYAGASGFMETSATSTFKTITEISYPKGVGGGEGYSICPSEQQSLWIKPDSAATWIRVPKADLAANDTTGKGFDSYYTESILRVSDIDFSKTNNKSYWFGFIAQDLFNPVPGKVDQHSAMEISKFAGGIQDSTSAIDTLNVWAHDLDGLNPQTSTSLKDNTIIFGYLAKTGSADSAMGGWSGTFKFGCALRYKGGGTGSIKEVTNTNATQFRLALTKGSLSFQLFVCGDVSVNLLGDMTNADSLFGDHRVEGLVLYFQEQFDSDWFILEEIDAATAKLNYWEVYRNKFTYYCTTIAASSALGIQDGSGGSAITPPDDLRVGMYVSGTGLQSSTRIVSIDRTSLHTVTLNKIATATNSDVLVTFTDDHRGIFKGSISMGTLPILTAAEAYKTATFPLTHIDNHYPTEARDARVYYAALYGVHNGPVYKEYTALTYPAYVGVSIDAYNTSEGVAQVYWQLLDESLLMVSESTKVDYTVGPSDYTEPPGGPEGWNNPGGNCCPVAIELYGLSNKQTYKARHYVMNTNNLFTRVYKKYGIKWAERVRKAGWIKPFIKPIWDYLARQEISQYYNKATGHVRATKVVKELKIKYPGLFNYYLIGSNARNEIVTHYYDIQITPLKEDIDLEIYEDILKTLYYVQEKDGRLVNPHICPQFLYMKDYTGKEVYDHREDKVDCYFYYDRSHPKNYDIDNLIDNDPSCTNIYGDLWRNKMEFMCAKWRYKGLDKLPYFYKEIN